MSGVSDSTNCPNCGKSASRYTDYKPYDMTSTECLHCGFYVSCTPGYLDLKELNELIAENGKKSLKKLPEQDMSFI